MCSLPRPRERVHGPERRVDGAQAAPTTPTRDRRRRLAAPRLCVRGHDARGEAARVAWCRRSRPNSGPASGGPGGRARSPRRRRPPIGSCMSWPSGAPSASKTSSASSMWSGRRNAATGLTTAARDRPGRRGLGRLRGPTAAGSTKRNSKRAGTVRRGGRRSASDCVRGHFAARRDARVCRPGDPACGRTRPRGAPASSVSAAGAQIRRRHRRSSRADRERAVGLAQRTRPPS